MKGHPQSLSETLVFANELERWPPQVQQTKLQPHLYPCISNLKSAAHCHAAEKMIDTPSLAMGAAGK
jgi:hypothetical protein